MENDIEVGKYYIHGNGKTYMITDLIRLKFDSEVGWVAGVVYINNTGMTFCRPLEIFQKKFRKVDAMN